MTLIKIAFYEKLDHSPHSGPKEKKSHLYSLDRDPSPEKTPSMPRQPASAVKAVGMPVLFFIFFLVPLFVLFLFFLALYLVVKKTVDPMGGT